MTRKDFEMVAAVLREQAEMIPPDNTMEHSRMAGIRLAFHDRFKVQCKNFDGAAFLIAAKPREGAYMERINWLRSDMSKTFPEWLADRYPMDEACKPAWIYTSDRDKAVADYRKHGHASRTIYKP